MLPLPLGNTRSSSLFTRFRIGLVDLVVLVGPLADVQPRFYGPPEGE